ncbi:hypothetical protein MIND_01116300 [Mycena indigotica]|uniref:Uncharacterized protein n=1 Tax=Mycena indigotica TaxID=2126181 RepID=A0A8H6S6W2_9AGAR|nr:uncharacterized protein MIND_01116300 [Mycena indigotica]KAF7293393.1 hypothetical protein MIND_01116300 [Mycena indigotica]
MADQTSAAVAQLSMRDRRAYREFMFPPEISNATHQPFFSLENAALWITAWGLELFLLWDDSEVDVAAFDAEAIRGDDLISFRDTILPPEYAVHEFFSLDNAIVWVLPTAYAAYVAFSNSRQRGRPALIRQRGRNASSQATSPAPSRTRTSSASSRAASVLSRHSEFALPSRSISRASHHSRFPPSVGTGSSLPPTRAASISSFSRQSSRRSLSNDSAKSPRSSSIDPAFMRRSPSADGYFQQRQSRSRSGSPDRKNELAFPLRVLLPEVPKTVDSPVRRKKSPSTGGRGRRRGTQASQPNAGQRFQMTRELSVERVIDIDSVPPTWSIPRDDAVYRLKLAEPPNVPQGTNRKRQKAKEWTIDGYIKHEDQDSWGGGSAGHKDGDVWVTGFADDLDVEVWARRSSYHCNGVNVCELVPDEIFADCERYDIDVNAMRELWQHELDSKEREASSYGSLLLRFYARVMNTKCKRKDCPGHAIMILLSHGPNQLGKIYFIGCSEWHPSQRFEHIYIPIPANINETMFKFMFDNNGQLPAGLSVTDSDTCYITAHPRVHMSVCPAGHSVNGFAIVPKIIPRPCLAEIIMFIPAPFKGVAPPAWLDNICLVYLRNFHNHPAHPHSKPSVEEEARLEAVINAIGVEGLTNSPLTVLDPLTIAEYNALDVLRKGELRGARIPARRDLDAGLEVGSGLEVSTALQVGTLDMAAIDDFDFQMSPRTASAIARAMDEYEREHGAVLTSELATLAAPASMVAMPPAASEPNGGYTGIPRMDASGLESLSSPDGRTEVSGDTVGLLDTRIVAAPTEAESLTEAAHPAGPSTSDTTPEEPRKRRRAATTTSESEILPEGQKRKRKDSRRLKQLAYYEED